MWVYEEGKEMIIFILIILYILAGIYTLAWVKANESEYLNYGPDTGLFGVFPGLVVPLWWMYILARIIEIISDNWAERMKK